MSIAERRFCGCGCGETFEVPPCAPHKRFVNAAHRNFFWSLELAAKRESAVIEAESEFEAQVERMEEWKTESGK